MNPRILLILLIMCLTSAGAAASEYIFSTVSLNEGLSQSTVRAILRDSRGYLWIGTKGGLNRYDGGRVETFFNDTDDPSSITDNDVLDLFEDDEGTVWVVCDKGVALFDRMRGRFNRLELNGKPLRVRSHLKRPAGIILGGAGLYFYDYETHSLQRSPVEGGSNDMYTSICEWGDGRYVLATRHDGLWMYDSTHGKVDRFPVSSEPDIMASHVDNDGNLWMSVYGEGLRCYDRSGRHVHTVGAEHLGSGIVLDLLAEGDTLWIATDGGGLHMVDTRTRRVSHLQQPGDRRGRGLRAVTRLYRDDHGYIYAGTVREGLTCITGSPMRTFNNLPGAEGLAVTSLFADGDNVWIGVDGGGVVLYEPTRENNFTPYASTASMKVTSFEAFDDTHLLLSTFDSGLYLFDKNTGVVSPAPAVFDNIVAANSRKGLALDLRRLPDNRIAILSDCLYVCDLNKGTVDEIPVTGVAYRLNEFYTDLYGLYCFSQNEILRYDLASNRIFSLARLPETTITCAAYDGNRFIYFGTSGGIRRLDTLTGDIGPMDDEAPMLLHANAMIWDSGRLWIGADGAVYMKNFNTGQLCRFDRFDGVSPNEFIYKSTLATPERLYMGGVNGLLKVDRAEVPDFVNRKESKPVKVTDVTADGVILASMGEEDLYNIPYGHSTISMRVDGGDTHPMRTPQFRFFINAPDGETPIESAGNTFSITHLADGGHYEIFASYVLPDGTWSSPRRVAIINVELPWWKTAWATVAYILLGLALIVLLFIYLVRRRRRTNAKRIELGKREVLEKEVGFLMEMNHELRTPLTLIYARLRSLIESMKNHRSDETAVLGELDNIYQSTRRMRDIINTTIDQWITPEGAPAETPLPAPEPETHTAPPSVAMPVDTSAMTVIIAEGDPELRTYMAENLQKMFGRVLTVPDGTDALTEVKNTTPDLIITDAMLPGMNGVELCRTIKHLDEYSHIPIIMLTTRVEDMSLRGGHDLGADIYIAKPFDMNQLANRCRTVLRSFDRVKQRYKSNASDILQRESYNNEDESFLLKIKEVIEKNISQPGFGVEIIVDKMLMSRSSLYTKFKDLTGQSLGSYIDDYRLGRAKEMLLSSDLTMSEISDALGFSTQRYFSTYFKKKTGMSPSAFRSEVNNH